MAALDIDHARGKYSVYEFYYCCHIPIIRKLDVKEGTQNSYGQTANGWREWIDDAFLDYQKILW